MLDLRWITENEAFLKERLKMRNNFPTNIVDEIIKSDLSRRDFLQKTEVLRSRRNQIAKDIGIKKRAKENTETLMGESQKLNEDLVKIESDLNILQARVNEMLLL